MKKLLVLALLGFSSLTFASNLVANLSHGESAFVPNADEEMMLIRCGDKTLTEKNYLQLESGSSIIITIGGELLGYDASGELARARTGEKVFLNCK